MPTTISRSPQINIGSNRRSSSDLSVPYPEPFFGFGVFIVLACPAIRWMRSDPAARWVRSRWELHLPPLDHAACLVDDYTEPSVRCPECQAIGAAVLARAYLTDALDSSPAEFGMHLSRMEIQPLRNQFRIDFHFAVVQTDSGSARGQSFSHGERTLCRLKPPSPVEADGLALKSAIA